MLSKQSQPPKKPRTLRRYTHEWVCKAEWRNTALLLKVEAANESMAWHRAWGQVSRMMGGDDCLKVILLRQTR